MGRAGKERTKFQPSSSSQAFSQIQQTGFIGFSSGLVPGGAISELSGDLQLAFKKAGKKDSTTKIKAFTELQHLFTTPEVDQNIESCLELWSKVFKDLLLEKERRAREIGLRAHDVLMGVAGRRLAPYLKKICGPWLLFMHDSNRNVRSLSSQAFFRAIPEKKHVATWIFCKNDLITFLGDRLDQTKVALCPPTIAKGTEASEIYEENMAECLLGLSFLLRTLPENELESVMERLKEIVLRPSFWKLPKIKSSLVLSAFLSFLGHALKVLPVLKENPERTFLLFSDVLKSQDRLTCQLVWRPLFYFATESESSWDTLPAKDLHQFEANLFSFLRAGASGTGSATYPELARLIPELPSAFTSIHKGDQSKFFEMLLQALWKGSQIRGGAQHVLLTCYVDVLLNVVSRNNLPGAPGSLEETAAQWLPLFSCPLQEVLTDSQWDVENEEFQSLAAEFVRVFNKLPDEQQEALPIVFNSYKDIILQSMESLENAEPRQQLQVATKVAVLLGAFQHISRPVVNGDAESLRQQVFSRASENLEMFPNLIIVGEMMRSQPLKALLPADTSSLTYFDNRIAPAASALLNTLPPDSPGMRSLLNILAQLLKQLLHSKDQLTHARVWKTLLELFQHQPSRGVLLTFLKQNVTIEGSPEAWRCAVLDDIALQVAQSSPMSTSEQDVFFEFLTFILGGQTMTSEASLISKNARVSVFESLVNHCALYHQEKVQEGEFIHLRLQHIMYCLKLISECLATNLLPGTPEGTALRLQALTVFFTLSIDIKYFWKGYKVDMETFRIISTHVGVEDFAGLSGDLSLSLELLEKSPVAQTARHGWNMNASSVLSDYEKEKRMEFLQSLVDCIHNEMKTVETTWFRPYLHTEQVKLLLTVVEHSSTQFILDNVVQTEGSWRSMKKSAVASFKALVDFYKLPIAFYQSQEDSTPLNQLSPEDEKKSITYVRFLSFLTCLMKELGVEEIVGKSDFRRMWVLHELYCGYTLCKDLLIPPLDHTNVVEEDWALGAETLVDFVNKDLLFFSQSIGSPFLKSLLTATLARAKASERQLVDIYAMGYLLRRCLSGDHQRSAEFLGQFEPNLASDLSPQDIEKKDLLYYQAVLPEVVGNLKANQLASYGLEDLYQAHMEALMSQQITELGSEILIHFLGVDGIVQDANRADVVASLVVFISEWGQQQIPVVQDKAIQVQLLRLLSCFLRHPLIKEQVAAQIEMVSSFVQACVLSQSLPTELNAEHSILFYAFKLLNMIYRVPAAKGDSLPESLAQLCEWQVSLLQDVSADKYSSSQATLYQALSQALLVLPPSVSISEEAALKLQRVLAVPHADIQKAAFVLLQRYIGRLSPLSLQENSTPQLADLLPARLSEHLRAGGKDLAHAISDEHDDVDYQYRSDLVKVVTFCWTWMLICEFYRKQGAATRRMLSGALRTEVPSLMGFLFQYFEQHTATSTPNRQLDVRGFDPLFSESFDQFLCDMYLTILRTFPSLVREWWCNDCNRALTNYVEQFTTKQMSPTVIAQEISIIQEFKHDFDDFEVKGNAQIKQVQAFYEEDEVQLGICLTIPDSYPLRDIVVTTEKKIGVTESQWRQWLLSMHMLLHTQDASILDAVLLWKERMDKLFEGIECCLICYSVFQASNNALPKLACKTCKNKFHSACLYKWFNTSHKSNCPLCQTPWME